jgi:hypothetical protein
MRSDATTVENYLSDLPADRRGAIEAVRQAILDNLPPGYEEVMNWGMITYQVPLETYPDTYNGKPLMYAALASAAYKATGKRLYGGKSCVRFKKLEDLPLELIGDRIASQTVDAFVAQYEQAYTRKSKKR